MGSDPLVTVVIPTWNRALYLPEAVNSALQQRAPWEIEVIIVDDGSDDETESLAREIQASDRRARYLRQERRGPSAARNLGLAKARGAFVQFLDSDDLLLPSKLLKQVALLQATPRAVAATCAVGLFKGDSFTGSMTEVVEAEVGSPDGLIARFLRGQGFLSLAPLYRTEACRRVGGWNEVLWNFEDWDFNIRIALLGRPILHTRECLAASRIHGGTRLSTCPRLAKLEWYELFLGAVEAALSASTLDSRWYSTELAAAYRRLCSWYARVGKTRAARRCARAARRKAPARKARLFHAFLEVALGYQWAGISIWLYDRLISAWRRGQKPVEMRLATKRDRNA